MKKFTVVLVGGNGYGRTYLNHLLNPEYEEHFKLIAVVDSAELDLRDDILKTGAEIYGSLEDFYKNKTADLAIISTPPFLHESMSIYCMEKGSSVLCEKPLTPTLQQARNIQQCIDRTGKKFGVGFQWSYSPSVLELKKDILDGLFGKPLSFWTFMSWPRGLRYYDRWTGNLFDSRGNYLLDSVAANATAHYLHNSLFLLGDRLDTAAKIKNMNAELYRANDIESYDTCTVKYNTVSGVELGYTATHATNFMQDPILEYRFENGVLNSKFAKVDFSFRFDRNSVYGNLARAPVERVSGFVFRFNDGREKEYGYPSDVVHKTLGVGRAAVSGEDSYNTCKLYTVLPHLTLCNAMLDFNDIVDFPAGIIQHNEEAGRMEIPELCDQLRSAFDARKLPSEAGLDWAKASQWHDIENYDTFSGSRIKKA